MPLARKFVMPYEPISAFEDSVVGHLRKITESDQHTAVIASSQ